jgi:hypothetical protein
VEARRRAHARVEDRIREAKNPGLGRFPSRTFAIKAACLELALAAIDLIAVLDDALAQIPDARRHGTPILIRTGVRALPRTFLAHIRSLRDRGVQAEFLGRFHGDRGDQGAIDTLLPWAWLPST